MNPFRYERAATLDDAFALRAREPAAAWIAGGTNLIDWMKEGVERPPLLIDVNALPLAEIYEDAERVYIGALVRMSEVAAHPLLAREFPAVVQSILESASPQLRNMASIAGNLMQRTRCLYFRDLATPCNKRRPGDGCSAIGGWTRQHAILGTSEACINTHASDLAVALSAADAVVHVASRTGTRDIAIEEFYLLPGDRPDRETVLQPGELITGVSIPRTARSRRSLYRKVRDRATFEFALVSAAVAIELVRGRIDGVAIALGGVAPKPWRARAAEEHLQGAAPDVDLFEEAALEELGLARGYGANDFKIPLAQRVMVRALREVTGV